MFDRVDHEFDGHKPNIGRSGRFECHVIAANLDVDVATFDQKGLGDTLSDALQIRQEFNGAFRLTQGALQLGDCHDPLICNFDFMASLGGRGVADTVLQEAGNDLHAICEAVLRFVCKNAGGFGGEFRQNGGVTLDRVFRVWLRFELDRQG